MIEAVKLYVHELQQPVQTAALNFNVWWVYKSKDTRPKYVDVLNRYPLFFQTSIHAHFVALLVALYGLYETRKDTYNIPDLLKQLRADCMLPTDILDSIQSIYDRAKPLWVKVSILRNNAYGHRSKAHTVEDVFKRAGVSPDELKLLVELTEELLNEVTLHLFDSTHAFNLDGTHDTLRMLDDLCELHDKNKHGVRKQII